MRRFITVAAFVCISFLSVTPALTQSSPGTLSNDTEAFIHDMDFYALGLPGVEISFLEPDSVTVQEGCVLSSVVQRDAKKSRLQQQEKGLFIGYNIDTAYVIVKNRLYFTSVDKLVSDKATRIAKDVPVNKYLAERGRLKAEKERNLKNRENQKQQIIRKYGEAAGININQRKVYLGMTKEMVADSWGRPRNVQGGDQSGEQWIYSSGNRLYFRNGRVSSIKLTDK